MREARLTLPSGAILLVEVARTDAEKERGLGFRDSLALNRGMLFPIEPPSIDGARIWMKGCRFSLDVVWLDSEGSVVHVKEKAPLDYPEMVYGPPCAASWVLELHAGQARPQGLMVGAVVRGLA